MKVRKNDIRFHEVLKQASIYSYEKGGSLPAGYKIIDHSPENDKGFSAVVLSNGQDTILAIRGTEITSQQDLRNDIAMSRKRIPEQLTLALDFYDKMVDKYGDNIIVAGHSLGGSLAQFLSVMRDAAAVTFNAYGIKDMFEPGTKMNEDNTVNYVNEWDGVAMANGQNHVGKVYAIPNIGNNKLDYHRIEGMDSLSQRVEKTPEEIQKTAERLHPKLLYAKKSIANSVKIHNISNARNILMLESIKHMNLKKHSSECAGTYSVSGYTRSDGTEVNSYTRTCGAKHNN